MNGKLEREISPQEYNILHIAFKMHSYIPGKQIAKFAFLAKNPEHRTVRLRTTDNITLNCIILLIMLCCNIALIIIIINIL